MFCIYELIFRILLVPKANMTSQQDFCRAAVHLSNNAVAMMERQSFAQAQEVLSDAVVVLRHAARIKGSQPDENTINQFLGPKIQKAAAYMASGSPACINMNIPVHTISDQSSQLDVAVRCTASSMRNEAAACAASAVFPIRIDISDHELADMTCQDYTPLIVYNFSLTYFCTAKLSDSQERKKMQLANALRTLRLCGEMILLVPENEDGANEQSYQKQMVLSRDFIVAVLCQRALVQVLADSGRMNDAAYCWTLLESMSLEAQKQDSFTLMTKDLHKAAAAA